MIVTVDPDIIVHSTQFVKRFNLTIVIVHPDVHSKKGKNNLIGVLLKNFPKKIWRQDEMKGKIYQYSYEKSSKFVHFCC